MLIPKLLSSISRSSKKSMKFLKFLVLRSLSVWLLLCNINIDLIVFVKCNIKLGNSSISIYKFLVVM